MERIKKYLLSIVGEHDSLKKVLSVLMNKYFITGFLFLLWLLFFDRNNLIERVKLISENKKLEEAGEYYKRRIEEESRQLKELKTNNKTLEKYAREQYFMKKENEDVFIITEK